MERRVLQNKLFGDVESQSLEHRCYNGICLFTGVGSLLAGLLTMVIGIGWVITLVTSAIGVVFLALYARSRPNLSFNPRYRMFVAAGTALLAATWFWNGGLTGSGTMVALVALVALITIAEDRPYRFVGLVLIPLMSILFLIEYFAPTLIVPYTNRVARFVDLYLTLLITAFVISQIILMILQAYRDEHSRAEQINDRLKANLAQLQDTNQALENALTEVKILSGLLPICASCHSIRNDKGYWDEIETYIQAHSEATFSHGLCPDCAAKLYPGLFPDGKDQ